VRRESKGEIVNGGRKRKGEDGEGGKQESQLRNCIRSTFSLTLSFFIFLSVISFLCLNLWGYRENVIIGEACSYLPSNYVTDCNNVNEMYNDDLSSFDVSDNIVVISSSFRILTFTFILSTICTYY